MTSFITPSTTFYKLALAPKVSGNKVKLLIRGLQLKAIKSNMSLKRQDKLDIITNKYKEYKYISEDEFKVLHKYWVNFIMNDYVDIVK